MNASIAVIIVSYNTPDLTMRCLESFAPYLPNGSNIYVIDNASPSNDGEKINKFIEKVEWGKKCNVIISSDNRGFGSGNNIAFNYIRENGLSYDYFLMLNPDTSLEIGAVEKLISFLNTKPKAAVVGSRLTDVKGGIHTSCFNFPTVGREFFAHLGLSFIARHKPQWLVAPPQQLAIQTTDWVAGACLLVRPEALEQVGYFDEKYFLYFEETDLMLALKKASWEIWYCPDAVVVHHEGQSTGVKANRATYNPRPNYWFDSWRRYYVKNHGRPYAAMAALARVFGQSICAMHNGVRGRNIRNRVSELNDSVFKCLRPLLSNVEYLHQQTRSHDQ